jgi:hypothetical protein
MLEAEAILTGMRNQNHIGNNGIIKYKVWVLETLFWKH